MLAALPDRWDSRSAGGVNMVSPPRDQGSCGACVAFSFIAAAEAAVFSKTRPAATNSYDFSEQVGAVHLLGLLAWHTAHSSCSAAPPAAPLLLATHCTTPTNHTHTAQDLFFCRSPTGSCSGGWDLPSAAKAISAGVVSEPCRPYAPTSTTCPAVPANCAAVPQGTFTSATFASIADIQQHIVTHGAVATGFIVYKDFMSWWNAGAQGGRAPACCCCEGGHLFLVLNELPGAWKAPEQAV